MPEKDKIQLKIEQSQKSKEEMVKKIEVMQKHIQDAQKQLEQMYVFVIRMDGVIQALKELQEPEVKEEKKEETKVEEQGNA